jgi:8-oxo-dGTP pyrophosphatase MutT (NUDIX family)
MPTIDHDLQVRETVRVLLIDESDRLLLFSSGTRSDGSLRWYAVGGGAEHGESLQAAALREVREETGLPGVTLSSEVWTGQPWRTVREGITYEVRQHYFMARVSAFEVDTSTFETFERDLFTGHRWWSLDDLRSTGDTLRPATLPALFEQLLAKGPPPVPLVVAG